jgi:hypothetical protein
MANFVETQTFVKDMDEYNALPEKNFDTVVVQLGTTCAGPVLKD